jgi:enamine deaminase RidA (YjgF/YER057c/UK114 family)
MNSSKRITQSKPKSPQSKTKSTQVKTKSPVKSTQVKTKSTTKTFNTVKKDLVKLATKNKKTLTRAVIGSTVLSLYAINRKKIHEGLGKVLNRVTKPTQDEIFSNIKEATKETVNNIEEVLNKKNNEGKTIIQDNVNRIIKDNVYLADTVIPQAVNKILEENKDLASDIVKDAVVKLVVEAKDKVISDLSNLINYASKLNKNINESVADVVTNIVAKNNAFSEEEKQQIKDVEEYLIFKENFNAECSNYFRTPGGFPCENQTEADRLVIKYVFSEEGQQKVKEFQELKLVEKIEKYLIDTQQLKEECSTYYQPWIRWYSCDDKAAADALIQKYKTNPTLKVKIPK